MWSRNWQNDRLRNKLTSHSIESVEQAVGVRSDRRCGQITFGIDTAACRTVVSARHPATRGYRCHWDAEAGVQYSMAGRSAVWDEGRRLLLSRDTESKLMTTESRQAEVRRPLMAVNPMVHKSVLQSLDFQSAPVPTRALSTLCILDWFAFLVCLRAFHLVKSFLPFLAVLHE